MLLTTTSRSPSLSRSPTARPRLDLRDLQARAGARRHVAERAARVQQQLVLLARSARRAPGSRRRRRRCGRWRRTDPGGRRGRRRGTPTPHPMRSKVAVARPACSEASSNVAVAEVAVERVAIVRERGQDEIHPAVAVVVAGVDAHARLRACLAVHGHARQQARRSRSGPCRGCDTGSSGSSRWRRTDRRRRRRRSRWRRRRSRRRGRRR